MKSYQVSPSPSLYLNSQQVSKNAPAKPVEVPTNHIVVLDCSGSMYGELPKIREQLKKKLPKLIGVKDTLTMIWFSGRGQFGVLLEAEPVATLTDLQDVNKAIDRWIQPMGMTGFKEPLEEVGRVVDRIKKLNKGVFSLFFLTDGCHNEGPRSEVLIALEEASGGLSAATFVEYGYYADRQLLTSMAERSGGSLIFAESFDKYQPAFELAMGKKLSGAPKVKVSCPGDVVGGFVFTMSDGDLTTYSVEGGQVLVPQDVTEVYYLSTEAPKGAEKMVVPSPSLPALYAATSLFAVRMKPDVVLPILKHLGDVRLIEDFSKCFGKQKYSEFMDAAKAAAFDPTLRLQKGYDPSKVPDDDAYTVLDLLSLLANDESASVLLDHPSFRYSRIGRGRVDADEILSEEEQKKIAEITTKMASEKNAKKLKELQAELVALTANKPEALKFETSPAPNGYSISSLTYNEDRPNISFLVRKEGVVDLSSRITPAVASVPAKFPTFIFRNYAVVKDGLVNIESLPIRVSRDLADKLAVLLPEEAKPTEVTVQSDFVVGVINLRALPVINRRMVQEVSARALFEKQFELLQNRGAQKVYKDYLAGVTEKKKSASFETTYGAEGAAFLKGLGFTDYSGFNPKVVQAESTDVYMGKEMVVSIAGTSSLPKVVDAKAKMGKTATISTSLMIPCIKEVEDYLASAEYLKGTPEERKADFIKWIDVKAKASIKRTRQLIEEMARLKFAIVIGQVWFKEFQSLEENTMTLDFGACKKVACKVELKEVEFKI